jgi:uncharacterized protein YkwD
MDEPSEEHRPADTPLFVETLSKAGQAGLALMLAGILFFAAGLFLTESANGASGGVTRMGLGLQAPLDPTSTPQPTETREPTPTPEPPTPTPEPPTVTPEPPTPEPTRAAPRPTSTPRPAPPPPPPPAAAPPAAPSVALSPMEQQLFSMHNSERSKAGLGGLTLDPTLEAVARQRAQDMASKNYFSHTSPTGETAFTLLGAFGYTYTIAGENIARNNYPDAESAATAMTGFMNSSSHRQNVLEGRFNRVGIAVAFGADNMKYFAVVFAGH